MSDHLPRREPATRTEWIVAGIFLAGFAVAMLAEIADDFSPAKLSALLIILFWVPLLALHEGGHAVMAWVLGWHVRQIVIGMGKELGRFRLGTAEVEIRLFPIEGFVRSAPVRPRSPGLENALIYAAGPGIELLLAAVILLLLGPGTLFTASDSYAVIAWQSLAAAATVQAVLNLIPIVMRTPEGDVVSDGLGIILSLFGPGRKPESP
jgi:hypothetical protein